MKNVLLMGRSDSIFIRDFCEEVLDKRGVKAAILSQYYSERYLDVYQKNNISIINWPNSIVQGLKKNACWHHFIEYIEDLIKINFKITLKDGVDVIFVHYVQPIALLYFYMPWRKARKRILVFWGSDILRVSDRKIKFLHLFLKQSTAIVFMIQNQYEYFQEKVGHKYDKKVHVLDFGNSVIGRIDKISSEYSRKQCKEKFGFPEEKIIIHVGYNANTNQQHIAMMKSVINYIQSSKGDGLSKKLKFVFHISYGEEECFEIYMAELRGIMDKAFLDYTFVDIYLQDDELAIFRKTCDIFLYGNKTDALSASPLEYIYAGALFICPKWLYGNYKPLVDGKVLHYIYDDFDELGNVFGMCLAEYRKQTVNSDEFEGIGLEGKNAIKDAISWESLAPKWRSLYE